MGYQGTDPPSVIMIELLSLCPTYHLLKMIFPWHHIQPTISEQWSTRYTVSSLTFVNKFDKQITNNLDPETVDFNHLKDLYFNVIFLV